MRTTFLAGLLLIAVSGCGLEGPVPQASKEPSAPAASPAAAAPRPMGNVADKNAVPDAAAQTLVNARRGVTTKLVKQEADHKPPPVPPSGVMQLVQYDSPIGKMKAYVTPAPTDGKKHPAIIWITGGECNTIDECWTDGPSDNEQTAAAFRRSSIVTMFPSLRGGNDSPGYKEGMFGEVDDILAAAAFLAAQDYVDPQRIYLGGHSTGGTLVLLVAECSDRFRAVISFGPVASIAQYGGQFAYHDLKDMQETLLRSPGTWLPSITVPTFVIEGTQQGNIEPVRWMENRCKNPRVHFLPVNGATHFNVLAPVEKLIVQQILQDSGGTCKIGLTAESLNTAFAGGR
jgi:pimeloyl-ACP methyl ester carboxylesterase